MNILYLFYFFILISLYISLNYNYIIYFLSSNYHSYSSIHFIINFILNNNVITNNILYGIDHIYDLIDYILISKYFTNIDLYYYSYQIYYIIYIIYLNKYNYINVLINNYI